MDLWKYFAIGHDRHVICNPASEEKIDELVELLAVPEGGRVLDIACGKAEFLLRAVRRWKCGGVGVDLSPPFVEIARARVEQGGLQNSLEIVHANGSDYEAPPASFDVASCLGASWIWGGLGGTLDALSRWARPGGRVVVGEPYWRKRASPEYLKAAGLEESNFATHRGNVEAGLERGLGFLHAIVSDENDWDRYEGYQSLATETYALENPDDPDLDEIISGARAARDAYLNWGRDELGWAIYLFVKEPYSCQS